MARRFRFLTARRSKHGRVIAAKMTSTQLVAVDVPPIFGKRALVTCAPALEAIKPVPSAADDNFRHRRVWALAVAVVVACA